MAASTPPNVHVSSHPCVKAKLSQLRSASTSAKDTKTLIHEIATMVGCEALAHGLSTAQTGTVSSPSPAVQPAAADDRQQACNG